mmetsp:Transcript_100625/g.123193  ORF Transcript_100625/g.123193 Transcript_100625/m.123193 type:complete len:511 (-) Transcript_100625:53-1585(-)
MGNAVGFGNADLGNVAVERENFCQRLGSSLCGVCFGFILFLGSIFLLGWNEFNYVRNQAILLKVDKEVIEAGCVPSVSNVGKPIWASCNVQRAYDFSTDSRLQAIGLNFSGNLQGAWFKAESKILQWKEDKSCSSHSTAGGGKEEECTYDYDLEWVSSPIDSSDFYCYPRWRSGCQRSGGDIQNYGTLPNLLQQTLNAPEGTVGMGKAADSVYFLDSREIGVFPSQPVSVPAGQSSSLLPNKKVWVLDSSGGSVQFSTSPGQNSIGDVRTTFTQSTIHLGSTQLAIIARQGAMSSSNAQMGPWDTKLPGTMSMVDWASSGGFSKSDMIAEKQSENGTLVLALRFLGFILMWFGLQLITGPISLMPQVIPCCGDMLGEVVGCALCCINCLVSLAISLTVIGVAWLMARPILGVGLLLVAAAAVFGAFMLRKKFRKESREPSMAQPFMSSMPSAQPVAPQINMSAPGQQLQVACPQGVTPGQMLMITCPDGSTRQVQVPQGVAPGQMFTVII